MHLIAIVALILLLGAVLVTIGQKKGWRAILAFLLTAVSLIKLIVPLILRGVHPVVVVLIIGLPVVSVIIYLTEGIRAPSTIAFASVVIVFAITLFISYLFIQLMQLTGFASEEIGYVASYQQGTINIRSLFIAGLMLGTLGILVESVLSQVAVVEEMVKLNTVHSWKVLYQRAMAVGVTHLTSLITTLFLIYASVSLPLIIIFVGGQSSLQNIIANEAVAEEIVRTLSGALGAALSIPCTTGLMLWWLKRRKIRQIVQKN